MSRRTSSPARTEPFHEKEPPAQEDDYRSRGRHDRDRILYSSAFRRLTDVTQVVAASNAHVFHNRLTHSIQVAQIGQSIAEKLVLSGDGCRLADELGGLDPDVVQAACLAHDLGHPPFGHAGEQELKGLALDHGLDDGFLTSSSPTTASLAALTSTSKTGRTITRW